MKAHSYSTDHALIANQLNLEKEYWLKKLSGDFVKSSFPYIHEESSSLPADFDRLEFKITGQLFRVLMRVSNRSDGRLYVILTAALCVLLNKYSFNRISDIIIGAPINRQDVKGELVNTVLVLRSHLDDNMTFKELLFQVKQTIIEASEHQNYPIDALLYQLNLSPDENGFPLFDVAILLENIHEPGYLQPVNINVIFSFLKTAECIEGTIEFNLSRYDKAAIDRVIMNYINLLRRAMFDVEMEIGEIDILSEDEKRQLLFDLNRQQAGYPENRRIHDLFELQVEKLPHHTALVFRDLQLTYEELNKRSNQLARKLRMKGVERGTIVALILTPSIEMIVGILAVLKAGGAYLPIDPTYPEDRILHLLDDSEPCLLLADNEGIKNYSFNLLQGLQHVKLPIHRTAPRPQIRDLDRLPLPDRSLVNYENFSRYIGLALAKNSMTLQATRGCPYNCAFCHKIWPKNHVVRSAENIFAEVKLYYELGVRRISFVDDIFNLDRENSSRFFNLIIENGFDMQIFFPAGVRGDILTREYIDLMVSAGTTSIGLALETASPRLQKLIGKNLNIKKLRENVEYIASTYPHVILEFFTMLGFPTETEEEALMTLNFIKSIKWIDFPIVSILKIYPNTDMEKLALENGISPDAIFRSQNLAFHELPETLPFSKSFALKYQADFLNNYFLSKERLMQVLPNQVKHLTEDEIIQKYDSYLPVDIKCFDDLLDFTGIGRAELGIREFLDESRVFVPDLNRKIRELFPQEEAAAGKGLRILLLDLSQFFAGECVMLYDVVEAPLGLINIMTYLKQQFGDQIIGKIAKSRIDFGSYDDLQVLIAEFEPDVIGLRTLTLFKDFFHKTASRIRQWGFDGPILAGGPYATSDYNAILQDRNIDLIVLGEGEITAAEVIREIIANNGRLPDESVLKRIPGVVFVPGKGGVEQQYAREIVILDDEEVIQSQNRLGNLLSSAQPDDLAYVIYTSGTTGMPKGMLIEHRNVVSLMVHENFLFDFSARDTWTLFHSYHFDFSVWEMYGALLYGGKLIVLPRMTVKDTGVFVKMLKEQQVTVLNQTPLAFYNLAEEEMKDECKRLALRYVIFGGDVLKPDKLLKWREKYPGIRLINMYGITETTVHVTYKEIGDKEISLDSNSIGRPLPTLRAYVLSINLDLLPQGLPGEFYVAGEGVGRGYLNRVELAAEKFIINPFKPGDRLYRSGDLVRFLDNKEMGYLGRIDSQVKIRGFRVELREIENQLLQIRGIKETVVTHRMEEEGEKYICAYVVLDEEVETSGLRDTLMQKLPDYMIPSYFEQVEKIPLSANGKVDRKKLPLPKKTGGGDYVAPGNDVQKKLVEIWSEELNIDKDMISIKDSFFELGGHSLKVTILISRIHQAFNVKVPIVEVFERQNIAELSEYIKGAAADIFVTIKSSEKREYYPLSSAQKRLYTLQQMAPESVSYNIPQIHYLDEAVDLVKLEDTINKLIRRHENLRASLRMVHDEPVQVISDSNNFKITVYAKTGETEIQDIMMNFVKPFNLGQAPLLRVGLINIGKRKVILVDMHHIISDLTSGRIFKDDFTALYNGDKLPLLRLQYKDFSEWQNSMGEGEFMKRQEAYWVNRFSDELSVIHLPTDYERPLKMSLAGSRLGFALPVKETEEMKRMTKENDVTLFVMILSLFTIFLSKLSGQEDIIIGTPVEGRRHIDLKNIIGMMVNILPIRTYPSGEKTFRGFLKEVKTVVLEALENQDYQFEKLVSKISSRRNTDRNPIFDVVFSMVDSQESKDSHVKSSDQNLQEYKIRSAKFDLLLFAVDNGDQIIFMFEYCTQIFSEQTIHRFTRYFREIIEFLIDHGNVGLADIKISHTLSESRSSIEQKEYRTFNF